MYLSRLILDTRQRQVRHDLGDAYQLHRTILAAFPPAPATSRARQHFGLLYRPEPLAGAPTLLRLLVQSSIRPDWSGLPSGYLGPAPDARGNPAVRSVVEEYTQITAGARLVFRLRANPTKRISDRTPGTQNTLINKRVALLSMEDQLAWLTRKGVQHGFRLLSTTVDPATLAVQAAPQAIERGRRPDPTRRQAHDLTFGAVLFSGQIEVADAAAFQAALANGIGSGKAFGFGLVSVAAAH